MTQPASGAPHVCHSCLTFRITTVVSRKQLQNVFQKKKDAGSNLHEESMIYAHSLPSCAVAMWWLTYQCEKGSTFLVAHRCDLQLHVIHFFEFDFIFTNAHGLRSPDCKTYQPLVFVQTHDLSIGMWYEL
uniref:Uncharacterized protein n=1 Tax=Trypanosoma congolense (strain IL3000) TaxID=1068625 RepID=F9W952_TRYCI|nr:hypothetical protein, unlikely [Trypanosoma congolense IL3000]